MKVSLKLRVTGVTPAAGGASEMVQLDPVRRNPGETGVHATTMSGLTLEISDPTQYQAFVNGEEVAVEIVTSKQSAQPKA